MGTEKSTRKTQDWDLLTV